jgi:hypothetical protein
MIFGNILLQLINRHGLVGITLLMYLMPMELQEYHLFQINYPGARAGGVSWIDSNNSFWLFGGVGFDGVGNFSNLI